jgi:hypothetical protein
MIIISHMSSIDELLIFNNNQKMFFVGIWNPLVIFYTYNKTHIWFPGEYKTQLMVAIESSLALWCCCEGNAQIRPIFSLYLFLYIWQVNLFLRVCQHLSGWCQLLSSLTCLYSQDSAFFSRFKTQNGSTGSKRIVHF